MLSSKINEPKNWIFSSSLGFMADGQNFIYIPCNLKL